MSCGIYIIENKINHRVYIGQSTAIEERWKRHKYYSSNQKEYPLYRAFRKYGIDNFEFRIIEECMPEELDEKEKYWITYYDSYNNGYNQTSGGQGVINYTCKLSNKDILEIYFLLANTNITQNEIAKKFNVGIDTISEINHGKTRVQSGYSYPIRQACQTEQAKVYCKKCGIEIGKYTKTNLCPKCSNIVRRKTTRPSREQLKTEIKKYSFVYLGNKYKVSDNAIRRWCKAYNLPSKRKEINRYSKEEWANI